MALETKLLVGDFIYGFRFQNGRGGGDPGLISTGVTDGSLKIKRLRETVVKRLILKDKVEVTVVHDEVPIRWLPWVAGKINYAHHEGKDVLSGMFTGCWMATYKEVSLRVAHIATQTDATDCKAAWRAHKAAPGVSDVKEVLPHLGLATATNLGLVSSAGDLYKIELSDAPKLTIVNPWPTAAEWMDPAKGKKPKDIAELMAKQANVNVADIYGFNGYRVNKIVGPLAAEAFPA